MMRVDPSAVPEVTTVYDFRMSQIARYNRDLSGTLFVTFLTMFSAAAVVCAYVLIKKAYAKTDVFVNFDGTPLTRPRPLTPQARAKARLTQRRCPASGGRTASSSRAC